MNGVEGRGGGFVRGVDFGSGLAVECDDREDAAGSDRFL